MSQDDYTAATKVSLLCSDEEVILDAGSLTSKSKPQTSKRGTKNEWKSSDYNRKEGKQRPKFRDTPFPVKLHNMLKDETASSAVTWMPTGLSWKIQDQQQLELVIPRFFGQLKPKSFTRQVTAWGFKRITKVGENYGSYYHPMFKREDEEYHRMKRSQKNKATSSEPNFYDLPPVEEDPSLLDQYVGFKGRQEYQNLKFQVFQNSSRNIQTRNYEQREPTGYSFKKITLA